MKVLVLGGTGLLGSAVVHVLLDNGHDVYATFHRSRQNTIHLKNLHWYNFSATQLEACLKALELLIRDTKPEVIINCLLADNIENMALVNSYIPMILARNTWIRIINISSNAVFGPGWNFNATADIPNPQTSYGFSKLAGECDGATNIRVSIIGINLWDCYNRKNQMPKTGIKYPRTMWNGVTNYALAEVLIGQLVFASKIERTIHICSKTPISKGEVRAMLSRHVFGIDICPIASNESMLPTYLAGIMPSENTEEQIIKIKKVIQKIQL